MTLPANSSVFIHDLSQTLAQNAPYLTLEFLKEWTIGFGRADIAQKTACLQYVSPWISNLETFASPSRDDAEQSIKQVAEIIRSLISITSTERKVGFPLWLWKRMS
jgi:neurofibromin 1